LYIDFRKVTFILLSEKIPLNVKKLLDSSIRIYSAIKKIKRIIINKRYKCYIYVQEKYVIFITLKFLF